MGSAVSNNRGWSASLLSVLLLAAFPLSAELMQPAQQTTLVQNYCAVCHTDAAKNGGLSLQHYNAASADPALAAMLLSKLNSGAMGAAGLKVPDDTTRAAWIAATVEQARTAKNWTVIRGDAAGAAGNLITASIVRDVVPRIPNAGMPLYRLTIACNADTRSGDINLTWSPQPQTDRTFLVSADGGAGRPHKLEGREEKMGNGQGGATGLAAALLNVSLPAKSLTVSNLFPGETVMFPLGDLDVATRQQLAFCFQAGTKN